MLHIPQSPSLKSKSCILRVAPEQRFGIKDLRRGITGCPPERSLAAIKGGWEAFARSTSILKLWLAFGFLLSLSWNLCSPFQQKMLEENLWVTKEVPATSSCNPNALIGSILDIMSLHIPIMHVLHRWVGSCCITSLGLSVSGCPRTDISSKET